MYSVVLVHLYSTGNVTLVIRKCKVRERDDAVHCVSSYDISI